MAARVLDGLGVEAAFEPGRLMAANAGVLLSRVIQVNERTDGRRFLVLDAAMNDLMRPALYDAYHDIRPVNPRPGAARPYDVVGPVCETGDTFARERLLPPLEPEDLVVFTGAGAYGAVMASEYNSRPLVPEVLVDGEQWAVIRPRPTYEEMLDREPFADWL
jgi:diaminopimelate decarboxylase